MVIFETIRCPKCNHRLVDLYGMCKIKCPKCKSMITADTKERKIYIEEYRKNTDNR